MLLRDFLALILAVCAMYVSLQHEGSFTFRKAFYHRVRDHDRSLFQEAIRLPKPILTDLNGDGRVEIVATTYDGKLQLLQPAPPGRAGEGFARARVMAEVQVTKERGDGHFVAVATGLLDPSPKSLVMAPRKEVVVLVTSTWNVYCLDHKLEQLWHHDLSIHMAQHSTLHEVGALVSSHTIRKDDRGVVIVGGSALHGDLRSHGTEGTGTATGDVLEEALQEEAEKAKHGNRVSSDQSVDETDAHISGRASRFFSYFAFEGATGVLRWKHEAKDFQKDMLDASLNLQPQHNYKLTAEAVERKEFSELSCRDFRESVIRTLPHKWDRREDSFLKLAHFDRHRRSKTQGGGREITPHSAGAVGGGADAGRPHGVDHSSVVARAMNDLLGFAHAGGGKAPSNAGGEGEEEAAATHPTRRRRHHAAPPNVFVAHLAEGIEAIHLYTGRSICKLVRISSPPLSPSPPLPLSPPLNPSLSHFLPPSFPSPLPKPHAPRLF